MFRTLLWLSAIVIFLIVTRTLTFNSKKTPVVTSINPTVGSPGDIMIISGENFGSSQGFSFVEIGGNKITSSCYLSWTDNQIKLVLPSNIQDGLVIVDIRTGRSKPLFFANETDIPVAIRPDPSTLIPGIEAISESTVSPGQLIVITGSNYGNARGNSLVYFTANYESKDANQAEYIAASDTDYDYEFWSDSEIKVRVPDGAKTGSCYVATDKGNSNHISITVQSSAGTKKYDYKRTYLVRSTADIANAVAKDEKSAITLRIPRPSLISSQPSVELSECSPEPVIENYKDTIVHQIQLQPGEKQAKTRFSQNFVISVYAINTNINAKRVKNYTDKTRVLYKTYTAPDKCVPSTTPEVVNLAKAITGKESNPYTKAKLIYDYMIDRYKLQQEPKTDNDNVLEMISRKSGDAYDFAILYTALLRASGIPALPESGILVDSNMSSKKHWWSKFYIENFGWLPVDIALGAGLKYTPFIPIKEPKDFYFGNLDSQHITFSNGWNNIKPTIVNSKTSYRPRSYALQSIWEEASINTVSYSSLWNDPTIMGIY